MSRGALARWAPVVLLAAIALGLHWPALSAGLGADDYLQRAMLDGEYPVARTPVDLYSFLRKPGELSVLEAGGIAPWWSHPQLKLSLLRPLSSLLIALDHRVLRLSPFAEHVHSFLWLAAFVLAYHLFARRLLPRGPALLATAIMAFDQSLVAPVAWICNRTSLISATLGALGLYFYLGFREEGRRRDAALAALSFTLALAGGEYAICALAFVAAYELVGARDAWSRRITSSLLAVVPLLVYLGTHFAFGYGAYGSVVYVGPLDAPRDFALGALTRIPSLIANELLLTPGEWVHAAYLAHSPFAYATLVPLAAIAFFAWRVARRAEPRARRMLATAALGALFGLLPLAGTVPSARLLQIPSFGGSAVVGAMIWDGVARLRAPEARRSLGGWASFVFAVGLGLLHLGFAPLSTHGYSVDWRGAVGYIRAKHLRAEIDDARVSQQDLVLMNAGGDISALIYPPFVRHFVGSPMPKSWRVLTSAIRSQKAVRVSDDTLELSMPHGTMFEDSTAQMFRSPELPFHVGDTFTLPGLEVRIEAVEGWAPTRVRYRFPTSLDDPNRVFLILENHRIRRVIMPPVGSDFMVPAFG